MALVKTVEMRILVDAGDAQAKLDELDGKAHDLDGNAIKMRFLLDDAKGKKQLDDLREKADRLGYKDVSIKVRVDGAGRAIAELDAVKHEEDEVRDKGIMNKIGGMFGGSPPLSGEGSAGGGMPIIGSLLGPAGLAIVPALEAALVEVTGLVSGFAAAGAGAGAFALLAVPAVKKVETAYSALNTAQQAYQLAQAKYQVDPSKTNKTAETSALDNLKAQQKLLSEMSSPEQGAVKGVQGLVSEFGKMSRAFEPQAFKVFNDALKVANHLLPAATPFANTFATALEKLLQQASKFTQSAGFKQFLDQFHAIEGPAVSAIGDGIGKIAVAFGKLITSMSAKDVAHSINIAFGAIAGAIGLVTGVVQHLMSAWDQASHGVEVAVHGISSTVSADFTMVKNDIHTAAAAFDELRHGAAEAADGVMHAIGTLPGRIAGAFAGAGGWLVAAGEAIMGGLLHGIEAAWDSVAGFVSKIAGFIANLKGPLDKDRVLLVPHGQAIMGGLMQGMSSQMPALRNQLAGITNTITSGIGTGGGTGGGDIHVHFHGLMTNPQDAAKQAVQVLKEYKRHGGGSPLGIA